VATVAIGIIGGSLHHLTCATVAALCGGGYLWRSRDRRLPHVDAAKATLGCGMAWIIGAIGLAAFVGLIMD
jgi:hypothetical protein